MKIYRAQPLVRPDLQAHLYSENLLHNVRVLRSLCPPGCRFCAVVKANAYGHGISEIVNILNKAEVDFFAVATFYEALHIAKQAKGKRILILEPVNSSQPFDQIRACASAGFDCVVSSMEGLEWSAEALKGSKKPLRLHLNVESGMGRCGLEETLSAKVLERIAECPQVTLAGVMTHFATADEEDLSYADYQLERFNRFLEQHRLRQRQDVLIHASNSAATIKMKAHFDMVRCGISMYGYYSRPMIQPPMELKPVLKLQAPITQIRRIPAGHSVSYGRSFVTRRDTRAGIIPLGYADGYRRCFSNCGQMKLKDHYVPVIGRVCMDQVIVDITDVPGAELGQMVTVIDNRHDSLCGAYELARQADTICYEILTMVHAHVNRIVH